MAFENFSNFSSGLGGIAGAAMSLIGGIGSGISARKNRKLARELAQKQQDFMSNEAEKAYQRNLEMWNKQNAYNSPSAQMARLQAAGLNPNLAYGSLSAGDAGNAPAYNPPSVAQPSDALFSNPYEGVERAGTSLTNSSLAMAQIAQTQANTKNVDLQNYKLAVENSTLLPAQIQDMLNEFAFNKSMRPQSLALASMQLKQADQNLKNAQKQFDILEKQLEGMDYETRVKAVDAWLAETTKDKKFESLCSQYDMTIEEGKIYAQKLAYELKTGQYNCQIAFSNMLEASKDNPLHIVEKQENQVTSEFRRNKLEGRKQTLGDPNTRLGRGMQFIQRGAGFLQSVIDGAGDIIGSFVGKVAGPTIKALRQ